MITGNFCQLDQEMTKEKFNNLFLYTTLHMLLCYYLRFQTTITQGTICAIYFIQMFFSSNLPSLESVIVIALRFSQQPLKADMYGHYTIYRQILFYLLDSICLHQTLPWEITSLSKWSESTMHRIAADVQHRQECLALNSNFNMLRKF